MVRFYKVNKVLGYHSDDGKPKEYILNIMGTTIYI